MTTSGFLPPSSRHGDCRWRPHSSPIARPDRARAGEADLVDELAVERLLEPGEGLRAVGEHEVQDAVGQRRRGGRAPRSPAPIAGVYSAGFQTTALPHSSAGTRYQRRHRDREVARGDDRRDADRDAEREELLVGHLARHRLAVEAPALAEEEVAGVDDLLHLAERLRVGLADLARDEAGERLLVLLDQAADLLDRAAADRRRHRGPLALGLARGLAGGDEGRRVAEADAPRRRPRCSPGCATSRSRPGPSVAACPLTIEATVRVAGAVVDMEPHGIGSGNVAGRGSLARRRRRRSVRRIARPPVRTHRMGRHARRARRPRSRPVRVGRRVADHPLRARRGRVAHGVRAPGLGAVARDRPGARRPLGRALARPRRRRLGGGERADDAGARHPLLADRSGGLLSELRRRRHRVGAVGARGRRPEGARRDPHAGRAGGAGRGDARAERGAPRRRARSCSTTAGGSRPTASSGPAARGCRGCSRASSTCGSPSRTSSTSGRARRGGRPASDVGRLRGRRLRRRRRRRPRREGVLGPRGPRRLRRRRRPRPGPRARAPGARDPRPPLPRARATRR